MISALTVTGIAKHCSHFEKGIVMWYERGKWLAAERVYYAAVASGKIHDLMEVRLGFFIRVVGTLTLKLLDWQAVSAQSIWFEQIMEVGVLFPISSLF